VCVCVLGRAGKKGIAVSFFTADDGRKARKLIDVLREAKQVKKKRECHLHIFALFMCGYYYFELCLLLTNMFCVCVCVCALEYILPSLLHFVNNKNTLLNLMILL